MSNSVIKVQTVFSNVKIPANGSFKFAVPGLSPDNYYSYSLSSNDKSFLFVTTGWYDGDFVGPQCVVTNSGDAAIFDLILLSATQGASDDLKAQMIK